MKYQVIGWTNMEDGDYPFHASESEGVVQAVIKDIREHGYKFGGDAHETYCPVLNDGTKVEFSWRGWGAVMAEAWGVEGEYAYMSYYMDELIPEKERKYPECSVDEERISPPRMLRETFRMTLGDTSFAAVRSGKVKFVLRLFDTALRSLDCGDFITFTRRGHEGEQMTLEVGELHLYQSFRDLYLSACPDSFGTPDRRKEMGLGDLTEEQFVSLMEKKYPKAEGGVVAIGLTPLSHGARTYAYLRGEPADRDELEALFGELYPRKHGYMFGENEAYDADLNTMVKETIAPLLGREAEIKKYIKEHGLELWIEVVLYIESESGEPYPILPPDEEVVAFLYESGAKLDIDYYIR